MQGSIPAHKPMNELRQHQLRELAEQMSNSVNSDQLALAQGTLELLHYVGELVNALETTTETCFQAMNIVYDCVE